MQIEMKVKSSRVCVFQTTCNNIKRKAAMREKFNLLSPFIRYSLLLAQHMTITNKAYVTEAACSCK
jgi:hypothetical protein